MYCIETRKDGTPCRANAGKAGYCWSHDPALIEQRTAARFKGGKSHTPENKQAKAQRDLSILLANRLFDALIDFMDHKIPVEELEAITEIATTINETVFIDLDHRLSRLEYKYGVPPLPGLLTLGEREQALREHLYGKEQSDE